MQKTEQGDNDKEEQQDPPKEEPQEQVHHQVNIVTASPRNLQVKDPVVTYRATGTWPPQQEAQKYHTHPNAYDQASIKAAMDSRFPQGLLIQDLYPIPPDDPEDVTEPDEFANLSRDRRTALRARIQQAHSALAIESSPDGQTDKRTGEAFSRAIQHLSLIHICRCRRIERCRSRWSPYH